MPSDKPVLNFVVDPKLVDRLDEFRFKNRFQSRAEAIKWLLNWALDQKPNVPQDRSAKGTPGILEHMKREAAKARRPT